VAEELSKIVKRHNTFKGIFNKFQQNLDFLQSDEFPVKHIKVEHVSDEKTILSFIGRIYSLNFSSCMVDGSIKGKISGLRILDENNSDEIANIIYNGHSIVDVPPPQGEDPVSLLEDSCCLNLVLNLLSNEINA
jgi:hypothetical protein